MNADRVLRQHCWKAFRVSLCEILPPLTIASGVVVGLGALALSLQFLTPWISGTLLSAVFGIAFLVGGSVGFSFIRDTASSWLHLRDRLAYELNQTESAHDETGVLLLLHSFSHQASQVFRYYEVDTGKGTTIGPLPYYSSDTRKFDHRIHNHVLWDIEEAAIGLGRLVRFGGPTIHKASSLSLLLGVADWFPAVQRAMRVARLVIFVPEISPGLIDELNELRDSGVYAKTMVVIQAEREFGDQAPKRSVEWQAISSTLSESGFHLPPYMAGGAVYIPRADFSVGEWLMKDLEHDMSKGLRHAVETALDRGKAPYVCVARALPYIQEGKTEADGLVYTAVASTHPGETKPDENTGLASVHAEALAAAASLYSDPPAFFTFVRRRGWTAVLVLAPYAAVLAFALSMIPGEWSSFLHQMWTLALPSLKVGAGIMAVAWIAALVAIVVDFAPLAAFAIGFLGPCASWLFLMVGFVGGLPSDSTGILMGSVGGLLLGAWMAWGATVPTLSEHLSFLRMWMFFIFGFGGLMGIPNLYYKGGMPSTWPATAFGVMLVVGVYRPYNWLLHGVILLLPPRRRLVSLHPASWDRVCSLTYPGLEFVLARFAVNDWTTGLEAIRRVGRHAPLRRAAARAEQAVYTALAR